MRALISVSSKDGIADLGKGLESLGWEVFSTGGTERSLRDSGVAVKSISDITHFPEIMDGRVKTLHPQIHGGILARRGNQSDERQMAEHGIQGIDLVAVNLYPFRDAVADPNISLHNALEEIDIGGPTLLRAAAKNFPNVLVLIDAADYAPTLDLLRKGGVPPEERQRLAQKAFQHVAIYDSVIAQYLTTDQPITDESPQLSSHMSIALEKVQDTRYGENPHQRGALYRAVQPGGVAAGVLTAQQLGGRELSFNNILDADAAWAAANGFTAPTVAVIKHTNPCGLASNDSLAEAYRRAFAGDTVSAYGGIVATNRPVDEEMAQAMKDEFYEIVIAPGFSPEALTILQKKRNLRILSVGDTQGDSHPLDYRHVAGGFLVQTPDSDVDSEWSVATERAPTEEEMEDLRFAWCAVRFVKSNAILLAKDQELLGMGAGQPNRVTSVGIALDKAADKAKGSVLASDAFFPFADGIETAVAGGITAIVQPGGSIRDEECIQAANAAGIAMVFTGVRHFRH